MDARVTEIAARQHGVVGRRQLLAAGVHVDHIDVLLRRKHVTRISRGVYLIAGAPLTPIAEMMAAAIRCGPGAVVVGEPVLALLRVQGADPTASFTILTPPGRAVTGVDWCWRPDPLPQRHRATVVDVPSVSPARNLLEVAVAGSDAVVERLCDGGRWSGWIGSVEELCVAHPEHPGAARLMGGGLIGEGAAESPPERHGLAFLREMGAVPQRWLTPKIRVDFVFESAPLVVEYYGGLHFGPKRGEYDKGREAAIRSLGYGLIVLTKKDMRDPSILRPHITSVLAALGG